MLDGERATQPYGIGRVALGHFEIAIAARAVTEPNGSMVTRMVARALPGVAPLGRVVWKTALPAPSVVVSCVTGATPKMRSLKVTWALVAS